MHLNKVIGLAAFGLAAASSVNAAYTWNSVHSWGGGYVPGVTFNSAGQAYVRTDVGGAYMWNDAEGAWVPLNDSFTSGNDMGSIAFAVDHSDNNNVYTTGGLYKSLSWCNEGSVFSSADGGKTWAKHPLNSSTVQGTDESMLTKDGSICLGGNEGDRGMGNRMAVNGMKIFLGTNQNGLLKSTDGGKTWTTIAGISNKDGVGAVAFDKSGNIYAAPYAGGLYKSTDGTKFTQVASTFKGIVYQMSVAGDIIWITSNDTKSMDQNNASGGHVYKFTISTGSIEEVKMPAACGGKSIGYIGVSTIGDGTTAVVSTSGCWGGNAGPSDPSFKPHEYMFYTKDGGANWAEIMQNSTFDAASAHSNATSNPHWISAVGLNPTNPDHIIFGTGYGVWSTTNATAEKPTWKFTDKGIEETVPLAMVSTTTGAPLVSAVGDIDGYYHLDLDVPMETRHQIEAGTNYDLDYAGLKPTKMIRIYKEATKGLGAVSNDAGKTWTPFTTDKSTLPPWTVNQYAGSSTYTNEDNFAALSADGASIVWNMAGSGVYYSTDDGKSWTLSTGVTSDKVSGSHVISDKKAAGVFYLYSPVSGELYKSADNGKSWTVVNAEMAKLDDYAYGKGRIFASPDAEGDLWAVQGINIGGVVWTGSTNPGVFHSTDGGKTFTKVALDYATYIGFGKGKTEGKSAIYAAGIADQSKSIIPSMYRSDDNGATWTEITDKDHKYGEISMIVGDPCIYSRVYLAGSGRGIIYGHEAGNKNTCPDRVDYNETTVEKSTAASMPTIKASTEKIDDNVIDNPTNSDGKALAVYYNTVTADSNEAGTLRLNFTGGVDWSKYTAISFDMRVEGESAGPAKGELYGWASVALFNMSGNWKWGETSLGNVDTLAGTLRHIKVNFGDGAGELPFVDQSSVVALGLNIYGTQFTGTMYLDNIVLYTADGTADTLQNFSKDLPTFEGIAKGQLIAENETGTVPPKSPTAIKPVRAIAAGKMFVNVQQGFVNATFTAANAGKASAKLINGLGQVIAAQSFTAHAGSNTVQLKNAYRGPAMLMVKQGSQTYIQKVVLK